VRLKRESKSNTKPSGVTVARMHLRKISHA